MKTRVLSALTMLITLFLVSNLSAQINVASRENGGAIEQLKGGAHAKEGLERMIDGKDKTRGVFHPPDSAQFRIRFFKKVHITKLSVLKGGGDKTHTVKDILLKTSSGKEIPYTLPEGGYSHRDRKAIPEYVDIPVDDICDYIDFLIQSAYTTGKAYTCIYEIKAETDEDIGHLLEVDYNRDLPHYIMRTRYESDPAALASIDPATVTRGTPEALGPDVFPKTIFSPRDIADYRRQIETNPRAKKAYAELLSACDGYLKKPVKIPPPAGNAAKHTNVHTRYSEQMGSLAFAHVLSGCRKPAYARHAIKLMRQYATDYADYGRTKHPQFTHDTSKITWQRLSEAMWGISVLFAYDMLKSDPAVFSDADADFILTKLLLPMAEEIKRGSGSVADPATNWSSYAALYFLMAGRLAQDEDLVNLGKYGSTRKPEESSKRQRGERISHKMPGLINKIRDGIDAQGNWIEPSAGYANMAAAALMTGSRIAWNMGENWFAIGGGNLRRLREAVFLRATPAGTIPGTEDAREKRIEENYYSQLDEHAALIYGETTVLRRLLALRKNFTLKMRFQTILPSIDFNLYEAAAAEPLESIYLPTLGYTIARQDYDNHPIYFLFDASIETSHGHPDKLQVLLHAHGKQVLPDPGSIWYANPEYLSWYKRTGTHNTVTINESNMNPAPPVLEIFASADRMHLVRATAPEAYPGSVLTRTTLQLDTILIDVFRVDTQMAAKIDYGLHFRGGTSVAAPEGEVGTFFTADPLKQLSGQKRHVAGSNAVFEWDYGDARRVRYEAVTENSEVFSGEGIVPTENPDDYVILRRSEGGCFFTAIDACVGESRVAQLEAVSTGNDALFEGRITYTDGHTGYVIVGYGDDLTQPVAGNGTSLQGYYAYLELDGAQNIVKAVYAGEGGIVEKRGLAKLQVSGPSVIMIDQFSEDCFTAHNMNNRGKPKVMVALKMPLKASYVIHSTDAEGRRTGATRPLQRVNQGMWRIDIDGAHRQEITDSPEGVRHVLEARRAETVRMRLEQERKARAARLATLETMYEQAAGKRPEGEMIVVHAEDFDAQEHGEIKLHSGRPGALASPKGADGEYFVGWESEGHAFTWNVEVKRSGYYALSLKYCSAASPERAIRVDGDYPVPAFRQLGFETTGGWSRDTDEWQVATVADPDFGLPWLVYLEAGSHTVTMENVSGGMNLDYFALHDYLLAATRPVFESGAREAATLPSVAELRKLHME